MPALSGGEARRAIAQAFRGSSISRSSRKHLKKRHNCSFTCKQAVATQQLLCAHHMEHENLLGIETEENPARRFDDLAVAVAGATELWWLAATFWMGVELLSVREYPSDQFCGGGRVFKRDVIGDGVQIVECWLGPDYLIDRAMRLLASACGTTLPSATANSPRAIPSNTDMRCWSSS